MNLNLEKFNPQKAELTALSNKYKNLKISDINDKVWYAAVDTARKELKKVRVQIQKQWKEMRDEANKFAKSVISVEKELVAIVEETEKELQEKQDYIDNLKELEKRKKQEEIKKQKKLEKEKNYQDFLKKNEGNFDKIIKEDWKIVLYKKIDEFII